MMQRCFIQAVQRLMCGSYNRCYEQSVVQLSTHLAYVSSEVTTAELLPIRMREMSAPRVQSSTSVPMRIISAIHREADGVTTSIPPAMSPTHAEGCGRSLLSFPGMIRVSIITPL